MADSDQQKTEAATPQRREEARKKGQFALSADLTTGIMLLIAVGLLWMTGPKLAGDLLRAMRDGLTVVPHRELGVGETTIIMQSLVWQTVSLCTVMVGTLMVVGLAMGALQTGFSFSTEALGLKWEKLSPVTGWGRLFSTRSAVKALMTILKAAAVLGIVVWIFRDQLQEIAFAGRGTLHDTTAVTWRLALQLAMTVAGALVVIGLGDYLFQRWRHEEDLKMSRQDVIDEHKQSDGDPHMKARVRKLQREMSRSRMIQEVKSASFVVRNPTHFAVALKYDSATMAAPKVIAKGKGFWALRIIAEAEKHRVPVIERKPLARALFATVEVGKEIPTEFYQAVVEILGYLYKVRRY